VADRERLNDKIGKGEKAKELLANPLLVEAFESVAEGIGAAWKSQERTKDQLYELWLMDQLLGRIRKAIERTITEGKGASAQLALLLLEDEKATQRKQSRRKER
jgi:hypothetical protein